MGETKIENNKNLIYKYCEDQTRWFYKFTNFFRFSNYKPFLKDILQFLCIFIGSFIFINLFSVSISLIYDKVAYMFTDSNIFQEIGKIIATGGTPYIDFFDHKGIYFFWYQALCYLIHPTFGFFLGEWIIFSITAFCMFKIFGLLNLSNFTAFMTALLYVFIAGFVREGNTTEDFSSLFIAPALYCYIRACKTNDQKFFLIGNIICGIGAGVNIFVRITNAAPLFFLVVFYAIYAFKNKKYKELFYNFIACLIPLLIMIAIPLVVSYMGGYFDEMIDQTFIMNMKYSSEHFNVMRITLMILDLLLAVFFSYFLIKLYKKMNYQSNVLLCLIVSIIGNGLFFAYFSTFTHYYIVVFPTLMTVIGILIEQLYLKDRKSDKPGLGNDNRSLLTVTALSIGLFISALGDFVYFCSGYYGFFSCGYNKIQAFKEVGEYIENYDKSVEEGNNEIFTLDVNAAFWLVNDQVPKYPHFAFQTWHNTTMLTVLDEVELYIKDNRPEWILIDDTDPFSFNNIDDKNMLLRNDLIENLTKEYSYTEEKIFFRNYVDEDRWIDDVDVLQRIDRGLCLYHYTS